MIIGSHVSMSGKEMLLGSVKEALSYQANTFMFYTGAPQNTARKPIEQLRADEAKVLMKENGIDINNVVVHALNHLTLLFSNYLFNFTFSFFLITWFNFFWSSNNTLNLFF